GLDLSLGMLRSASHPELVNADVTALPFRDGWADVIVAPHMLYHVPDRAAAAGEFRRVLAPGGVLIAVTNGEGHLRELREVAQRVVGQPGWRMRSPATESFRLENGADQLAVAFGSVRRVLPRDAAPVVITDPAVAADYVASMGDVYAPEVGMPWPDVVAGVRVAVGEIIAARGSFTVVGHSGAFVCR
ncbi:MAG TPA: class I SAM-dependent methyltransferase, partial [Streptosporangiaceae bacterium]